jgi:AcrR family transcriptional regulator
MKKTSARGRILAAAAQLSRECGGGNLSLDAIAAEAGVSKGGLLYHFPSKAALMRALTEHCVEVFEAELEAAVEHRGSEETLLSAYVRLSLASNAEASPDAAGLLAALAEDPEFMKPLKAFKRRLLDRLTAGAGDSSSVIMTYLALEGLFSLKLFDLDVLTDHERQLAFDAMRAAAK